MARSHITSTTPDADGTLMPASTTGVPADDHTFTNTGRTIFIITNSGASPRVAELVIVRTVQGETPPVKSRTLAAGARWVFGKLPIADFGRLVQLNVDHADLKIDVIEP